MPRRPSKLLYDGHYRIMLVRKPVYAEESRGGTFLRANYKILEHLTGKLAKE